MASPKENFSPSELDSLARIHNAFIISGQGVSLPENLKETGNVQRQEEKTIKGVNVQNLSFVPGVPGKLR